MECNEHGSSNKFFPQPNSQKEREKKPERINGEREIDEQKLHKTYEIKNPSALNKNRLHIPKV